MKRKMMTREKVPNNSTTNGGNGAYMNSKRRMDVNRDIQAGMVDNQTATGRPGFSFRKLRTKIG